MEELFNKIVEQFKLLSINCYKLYIMIKETFIRVYQKIAELFKKPSRTKKN